MGGRVTEIAFTAPVFRGKGRPRVVRAKSGFSHTYTPDATVEAENKIRAAFCAAVPAPYPTFPDGPVEVHITCYRPMPKSRPRKVESEPDVYKPDVDNLAKIVLDALNGLAWQDDTQVTCLLVSKADRERGGSPETRVWIQGGNGR